jgi:hypothetical protein
MQVARLHQKQLNAAAQKAFIANAQEYDDRLNTIQRLVN